jgi:hypothetical protein
MVNDRFPPNSLVWFRNGGWADRRGSHRHQSKIYGESSDAIFSQIPRDLTSMQTLAIYRGSWPGHPSSAFEMKAAEQEGLPE